MARFTVTLSGDEIWEARERGKKRGDKGPKAAIGEKALSVALRRRWEGCFHNLEKWDAWKKIGRVPGRIEVRMTELTVSDLRVLTDIPDDRLIVLMGDREAPRFLLIGWAFAGDVQDKKYWREEEGAFVMPHADLRPCWILRRGPRRKTQRLHVDDPADNFAGPGLPCMLDTDDGKHPSAYGNIIVSRWALPCRRCQKIIPVGALVGGNLRTGTIHGTPEECGYTLES